MKPDEVILWLAKEQFPNKENDLGESLLKLVNNGLKIEWCEDIKSYKKLIFALPKYPNDIIVTADDDIYYLDNWLELLYKDYLKNPNCIHSHRVKQITFNSNQEVNPYINWTSHISNIEPSVLNFFTGCGGVLYPPNSLHKDILNKNLFMSLCPTADDIWFWAMAVLNDYKINLITDNFSNQQLLRINSERDSGYSEEKTLYEINVLNGHNDTQMKSLMEHYPQILKILRDAYSALNSNI